MNDVEGWIIVDEDDGVIAERACARTTRALTPGPLPRGWARMSLVRTH